MLRTRTQEIGPRLPRAKKGGESVARGPVGTVRKHTSEHDPALFPPSLLSKHPLPRPSLPPPPSCCPVIDAGASIFSPHPHPHHPGPQTGQDITVTVGSVPIDKACSWLTVPPLFASEHPRPASSFERSSCATTDILAMLFRKRSADPMDSSSLVRIPIAQRDHRQPLHPPLSLFLRASPAPISSRELERLFFVAEVHARWFSVVYNTAIRKNPRE